MLRWLLLLLLILPFATGAQETWYKGDTHAHTSNSGTSSSPAQVATWYRDHGYGFVFITDYNTATPVTGLDQALGMPGRFQVFPGMELRDKLPHRPVHLTALGLTHAVTAQGGDGVAALVTADARAIREAGGLPILNHPNGYLPGALRLDELMVMQGISLMEICCADYRGGSGHPSTEELWDGLLSTGHVVYGVAADDAHDFSPGAGQAGSAWIMVQSPSLELTQVLLALQAGRFYATTGVELTDLQADGKGLCFKLKRDGDYGYRTYFIGDGGRVLAQDGSDAPCYAFTGKESYVRARVERSDGVDAWVQPVFAPGSAASAAQTPRHTLR